MQVYQGGKGRTTNRRGNWSTGTKKWREGTAAEGFDMVEQSMDSTKLHLNKMPDEDFSSYYPGS